MVKNLYLFLFFLSFYNSQMGFHRLDEIQDFSEKQKIIFREVIRELIDQRRDLNKEYKFGIYRNTPLRQAIDCADEECIDLLLKNGASVNLKTDNEEDGLLHQAVYSGNIKIIELLLQAGMDINIKDRFGNTVLISVLTYPNNCNNIVKFLLKNGANPNIKNNNKKTALLFAVSECNFRCWRIVYMLDVIKSLIYGGADTSICDRYGKNFIELAEDKEFRKKLKNIFFEYKKILSEEVEVWYV